MVEVKVSGSLSTAQMSSYRVTAQKPLAGRAPGVQCTGSSRRSVSNWPQRLVAREAVEVGQVDLVERDGRGL